MCVMSFFLRQVYFQVAKLQLFVLQWEENLFTSSLLTDPGIFGGLLYYCLMVNCHHLKLWNFVATVSVFCTMVYLDFGSCCDLTVKCKSLVASTSRSEYDSKPSSAYASFNSFK